MSLPGRRERFISLRILILQSFPALSYKIPPAFGGADERITVLAGKVVSEAGFAPGECVTVVLECESQARIRAHSDAQGDFSLMLTERDGGPGRGLLRTQAGTSAFPLADCELYGELCGYRSEHIRLPDSRDGRIVQVGVITLHPVSPEHGFSVRVTSLAAARKGKEVSSERSAAGKKRKWAERVSAYQRLALRARNAEAAHKLLAEFQERAQDPAAPVAEMSVAQGR